MMPRSVDLPQPEGPRTATNSSGSTVRAISVERDQILAAPVTIGLGQPVHDDAHGEARHSIPARTPACLVLASRLSSPGTGRSCR